MAHKHNRNKPKSQRGGPHYTKSGAVKKRKGK